MAKGDDKRKKEYAEQSATANLFNTRNNYINPQANDLWRRFSGAADQAQTDYGNIMGNFSSLYNAPLESEGYSAEDLASIRARNVSPIRGIYQRGLDELQRNKNLSGGYMPNYAAARSRFMRDAGQQISDINTNTNADIAELKHADLESRRNRQMQRNLAGASGMASLYGTTPGAASMFANNALQSVSQMSDSDRQYLMYLEMLNNKKGIDWGKWAQIGGNIALGAAMVSDRNQKEEIEPVETEDIVKKYKRLPLFDWQYKGDTERHRGPMAQDYKSIFGKGDGKSISLIDVLSDTIELNKALAERISTNG